jgi:UDP-glucose 4-epimerase
MARRFLVTGGAGYVGSHLVAALAERGEAVVVLDNLRTGHRGAVLSGVQLVVADLADTGAVDALLADGPWHGVFHFASLSQVGESMRLPFRYLIDNGTNGMRLIEACVRHGVSRFVLSSTAALYGTPSVVPIPEDAPLNPESPYGDSKLFLERALHWADRVHGLRYASLRYFNAAGADPAGRFGEDHRPESHLVPLVIDAALGRRTELDVYGRDYPTPDGTCLRDYVHVTDLADAHLLALDRLERGGSSIAANLGNSTGHSVLQVIEAVERVSGRQVPHRFCPRRPGDPAALVASSERARRELGWRPRFADLDEIVRTALLWREAHPNGYGD